MRSRNLPIGLLGVLLGLACGPSTPADPGDTDTSSGSGPSTGGTLTPGTEGPPPEPTTGDTEPTPGDTDPPPDGCPQGQAPFTQRWSSLLTPPLDPAFAELDYHGDIVTMADGRIALSLMARDVEAGTDGPAVVFTSPEGKFLGLHMGQLTPQPQGDDLRLVGMRRTADDELVQAGARYWQEGEEQQMSSWVARFAGDGTFLGQTDVTGPTTDEAKLGLLDAPLLLGLDVPAREMRAFKLKPGSAELAWTLSLAAFDPDIPAIHGEALAVASSDDGTALLAYGTWDDVWSLHLVAVDGDGSPIWVHTLEVPWKPLDAVAIPGGWVVMTHDFVEGFAHLWAFSATGASTWDLELTTQNGEGRPIVRNMHVTGDHLTIPVLRTPEDNPNAPTTGRTVAAHRVSLAGEAIDVTPLPGAAELAGATQFASAVGKCDELIVLSFGGWSAPDPTQGLEVQLSGWAQ